MLRLTETVRLSTQGLLRPRRGRRIYAKPYDTALMLRKPLCSIKFDFLLFFIFCSLLISLAVTRLVFTNALIAI